MASSLLSWETVLIVLSISWKTFGVSLTDDPSLWPGHKEPFGLKQPQHKIVSVDSFPEPIEFFRDYVDKSMPLLIKDGAKSSPAFTLWYDDYLKSHEEAKTFEVFVETGHKKENRTYGGKNIPLKEFIETYHTAQSYMVNGVPDHIQKDLRIPSPLRCEDTRKMLVDTVTWFSSGGTKSVLHNDDVDNMNCLFRGKKQLMFINYEKYKTKVKLDRPEGGYADVDVDAVDFTAYPGLREVEYINATMQEGDCVFIPYKWFHQVNSWANDQGMNVAVNVWFQHVRGHRPKKCKLTPAEATLDKYRFSDLERQKAEADKETSGESKEKETMLQHFEQYLQDKDGEIDFNKFLDLLSKDEFVTKEDVSKYSKSQSFADVSRPLFELLDANKNDKMELSDFDEHEKIGEEQESRVGQAVAVVEDYSEDVAEAISKGTSFENFEAGLSKKTSATDSSQDIETEPEQTVEADTQTEADTEEDLYKDEL